MTPVQAISTCLRKSFTFSGRAPRSEFWWFQAFLLLMILALFACDFFLLGVGRGEEITLFLPLTDTFTLLTLPAFAASISRRFHDAGLPGLPASAAIVASYASQFLFAHKPTGGLPVEWVPLLVEVLLLLVAVLPSRRSENPYGPNPHEVTP